MHRIARKRNRRLNSLTVCKMMTWSYCCFLDWLLAKAKKMRKKVVIISKAYMSKTCSAYRWVDQGLAGRSSDVGVVGGWWAGT